MNLALLPAEALLELFRRGEATPVDALEAVSLRILRHNPTLNAFAAMNPHAPNEARTSARRWAAGRPMGLLDGVPVTVKDLVDVASLPTRRGSRLTPETPVAEDAPLVVGLRAAGAVLVGKTTTTEFGWKTPGDSPLHGITRNPWNTRRTTGGSSCGAGAAGAACFGPLHVGTDAGGSIRIPAAWCGLVGLKPTYGRVPQWPAGAFSAVACAGPMARTVRDAALMLSAMATPDWRDPFCCDEPPRDWRGGIEDGVAGLRVGVIERPGFDAPADADAIAAVERAAAILADAGAEIVVAELPGLPDVRNVFGRVWGVALARLVATFSEQRRGELDAGLLEVAAANDLSAIGYLDADALRIATAHALARATRRYDLLLCPTVPRGPTDADAPTTDPLVALWTEWAPWTFAFNLSRQPAIAVPLGADADGMPRSVQLAAAQFRDDLVLRAARVIERAEPAAIAALDPEDAIG